MQLQYGNYFHAVGECTFTIDRQVQSSDHNRPYLFVETWSIEGEIIASTPAEVALRVRALENAYSYWYRDLTFYSAPGVVLHRLRNRNSMSGVRITTPPSFPSGFGAEGITGRKYRIVATADYPLNGTINDPTYPAEDVVRRYQETLTISGGGPRREIVELVNGLPILYTTHLETASRVTQSGSAIGFLRHPTFPPYIWPDFVLGDPRKTIESPRQGANQSTEWPISWTYTYAAPTTLVAQPGTFY